MLTTLPTGAAPADSSLVTDSPAAGREGDLLLLDCARCGEPMFHRRGAIEATYPLADLQLVHCGECGSEQTTWVDKPCPIRY